MLVNEQNLVIQPIVSYPRQAQVGKTYLVTVDLCQSGGSDWPYEEEELPIYCVLNTLPYFSSKPMGKPNVVLHRFGGTYGPVKFYLTANQVSQEAVIKILLVNQWGTPIDAVSISNIQILQQTEYTPTVTNNIDLDIHRVYLTYLFERVNSISLSGIDPKSAADAHAARLSLDAVYTEMQVLTVEEMKLSNIGSLHTQQENNAREKSLIAKLDQHPRLVLLGDPGSGKSMFVNFVTACLAGELLGNVSVNLSRLTEPLPQDQNRELKPETQPWQHGALLPVCVTLRDFAARGLPPAGKRATAKHLWDFIAAELKADSLEEYAPYLKEHLRTEGGLLLLDGLDEVPEAKHRREQLKQAVEDFTKTFGKCRVLVTSRTYAYQQQAWRLTGFAEAVLAPFTRGQIAWFAERWYAHIAPLRGLHPDEAAGRAELLKRAIFASDRLRGLAERPLLLTLMASLHAWRGGSLPEKREELYADTVDLLLDWWERPKVVRDRDQVIVQQPSLAEWLKVDRNQVRALLEHLAYRAHAGQPALVGTADIPEGDLLSGLLRLSQNPDVKPVRLVEYLSQRAGLLLPRGVGVYTFPHRTFQEYLAACYLTDHDYPDKVADLARTDPNRWREVALLAGAKAARGTASAVWALVDALCYEGAPALPVIPAGGGDLRGVWGALLAGQVLVENAALDAVSQRNQPKLDRVKAHLVALMRTGQLPAVERALAGNVLAILGDPRLSVGIREGSLPDIEWVSIPAGPFLMGSRVEDDKIHDNEKPQHRVALADYRISQHPITNAQFQAFVIEGGYENATYWTASGWAWRRENEGYTGPRNYDKPFNLPNHPAVGITWYEATAFCNWLTERLRVIGELNEEESISLPTEAQWEKAARGTDGRIYPWGDTFDPERANAIETGIGMTSAVGCFPSGVSSYGCLDMAGNVWEWTRSQYRPYPYDANDGRESLDATNQESYVLRGGGFLDESEQLRCAYRLGREPSESCDHFGFRVAIQMVESTLGADKTSPNYQIFKQGHALIIGVGADLPATSHDAQGLYEVLTNPAYCAYPKSQVRLLVNGEATRQSIFASLDELSRSIDEESVLLVYFSGHGYVKTSSAGSAYYLLPYDYNINQLEQTGISVAEFTEKLRAIKSQRLVVILDYCHSGGVASGISESDNGYLGENIRKGILTESSPTAEARSLFSHSGRVLIASAKPDEMSYRGKHYSVFTYALMESLTGAGVSEQDGYVRVADMAMYASRAVPLRTNGRQHPVLNFEGASNFILAYYAGGDTEPKTLPFGEDIEVESLVPERSQSEVADEIDKLITTVKTTDIALKDKRQAMKRLAELNPTKAKSKLADWIIEPFAYEEWESAVQVLSELDIQAVRDALKKALGHSDSGTRWNAASRIVEIADDGVWEALRNLYVTEQGSALRSYIYSLLAPAKTNRVFLLNRHAHQFLRTITPTEGEVATTQGIFEGLKERLESMDELRKIYLRSELFGSLARDTAIRPISDIDALVVFRIDPAHEGPQNAYDILELALKHSYKNQVLDRRNLNIFSKKTRLSSFGASVVVDLPKCWLEVLPAVVSTDSKRQLLVPNRSLTDWVTTHHKAHYNFTLQRDKTTGGLYRDLVKMVKWWQQHHQPKFKYLSGFSLECLVGMNMSQKPEVLVTEFGEILRKINSIYAQYPTRLQRIPDPAVRSSYKITGIPQDRAHAFINLISHTLEFVDAAESALTLEEELKNWQKVFGSEFPTILD